MGVLTKARLRETKGPGDILGLGNNLVRAYLDLRDFGVWE